MVVKSCVETHRYWLDARSVEATSGDFVECFPLGRDRFAVIVGDIAGRGAAVGEAARALRAYARSLLATVVPLRSAMAGVDEFFSRVVQCDDVPFATLVLMVIDTKDLVLEYASAGHEPPLLLQGGGRHEHLPPNGPVLGLNRVLSPTFSQYRAHFCDRSYVVVVTDGITEARRYDEGRPDFFGSSGVVRSFIEARRCGTNPARAIADAAARHAQGIVRDDATALVVALGPDL